MPKAQSPATIVDNQVKFIDGGVLLRGLLILAAILAILVFFLPLILGFVLFLICAIAVFMLLARFGMIPGTVYRTYTFDTHTGKNRDDVPTAEEPTSYSPGGWYQGEQNGEIVTLPENALKRDEEEA